MKRIPFGGLKLTRFAISGDRVLVTMKRIPFGGLKPVCQKPQVLSPLRDNEENPLRGIETR